MIEERMVHFLRVGYEPKCCAPGLVAGGPGPNRVNEL
jgi:hypothetical protein